ncbi:MAG: aminotransferase class I/II-fold pyridoxal phosphate-dependent enzyme [Cyanobacteria bacterium P01_F01_bin.150]
MPDTPFLTALYHASQRHHAPFYAPGHKQGRGISTSMVQLLGAGSLRADLPELPELDSLFTPEGAILEAQTLAAQTFGADQTWFLANGSTCGIQAAILAVCGPGDRILLPRNVHQSVISALILSGAVPIFIAPDYDPEWDMAHGIDPAAVATALLTHPAIKAIMIVSPTYYGTCSDVDAIARLAHAHQIPLIVDEAHGPHFGFHPDLPCSALSAGADVAIQSTHKVLSAMTQASMLHLKHPQDGPQRISPQRISQSLQLVQSTSPNALLLASLDAARHQMATQGHKLMQYTLNLAERARAELNQLPGLQVFEARDQNRSPGMVDSDRTRLTVDVRDLGLTGFDADDILHTQLGVTCELPTLSHLTFIISLGNTPEDITHLTQSFQMLITKHAPTSQIKAEGRRQKAEGKPTPSPSQEGDQTALIPQLSNAPTPQLSNAPTPQLSNAPTPQLSNAPTPQLSNAPTPQLQLQNPKSKIQNPKFPTPTHPTPLSPREAFFAPSKQVAIAHSVGHISAELICPYPPGIPLIMPGEIITQETIETLQMTLASGGFISGCTDASLKKLAIVS